MEQRFAVMSSLESKWKYLCNLQYSTIAVLTSPIVHLQWSSTHTLRADIQEIILVLAFVELQMLLEVLDG